MTWIIMFEDDGKASITLGMFLLNSCQFRKKMESTKRVWLERGQNEYCLCVMYWLIYVQAIKMRWMSLIWKSALFCVCVWQSVCLIVCLWLSLFLIQAKDTLSLFPSLSVALLVLSSPPTPKKTFTYLINVFLCIFDYKHEPNFIIIEQCTCLFVDMGL